MTERKEEDDDKDENDIYDWKAIKSAYNMSFSVENFDTSVFTGRVFVSVLSEEEMKAMAEEEEDRKWDMENTQSDGCTCYYNWRYDRHVNATCHIHGEKE